MQLQTLATAPGCLPARGGLISDNRPPKEANKVRLALEDWYTYFASGCKL